MREKFIKFSILIFTILFLKKILFSEWEFIYVDYNSIENLALVSSFFLGLYYWIIVAKNKKNIKRVTAVCCLLLGGVILLSYRINPSEEIDRKAITTTEDLIIMKKNPKVCLEENEDKCLDYFKVTKYKIFQKKERFAKD